MIYYYLALFLIGLGIANVILRMDLGALVFGAGLTFNGVALLCFLASQTTGNIESQILALFAVGIAVSLLGIVFGMVYVLYKKIRSVTFKDFFVDSN